MTASEEELEIASRHNIHVLLRNPLLTPSALKNAEETAKLDSLISTVKGSSSLEGYYILDEPGSDDFEGLGKLFAFIRKRDPAHFAYVNLLPTYATKDQMKESVLLRKEGRHPTDFAGRYTDQGTIDRYRGYLHQYINTVKPDFLSFDHYHFLKNPDNSPLDGRQYFLNLELVREASIKFNLPFMSIIQANTIEPSWRLPSIQEIRWLVYTTLAYGGRGISYFTYWGPKSYNGLYVDGQPSPLMTNIRELNKEIRNLGEMLLKLQLAGVYHSNSLPFGTNSIPKDCSIQIKQNGEFLLGLFKDAQDIKTFMIVNKDYRKASHAVVTVLSPEKNLLEFNPKTDTWQIVHSLSSSNELDLLIEPGEGRIFRVDQ